MSNHRVNLTRFALINATLKRISNNDEQCYLLRKYKFLNQTTSGKTSDIQHLNQIYMKSIEKLLLKCIKKRRKSNKHRHLKRYPSYFIIKSNNYCVNLKQNNSRDFYLFISSSFLFVTFIYFYLSLNI